MKIGKYIWTPLHKWIGLIFGVLMMLICFTGAILSFEKELLPLLNSSIYYHRSDTGHNTLRLEELVMRLEHTAPNQIVKSVVYPSDPKRNVVVSFAQSPETEVYVNPYNGEVVGSFTYKDSFFSIVRELHRFLLIGKTGRMITGSVSLLFAIMMISGIFINIPNTIKKFISNFRLDWRGNAFRKSFRLHIVGGWSAFVFLLIMSLTGPFWSFGWYNTALSSLFGVESTTSNRKRAPEAVEVMSLSPDLYARMDDKLVVLAAVESEWKELRITLPAPKDKGFTIAVVPKKQIHSRQADTFTYSLNKGELIKESVFKTKSLRETFRMWVFALHTGSWAGLTGKILYFLAALIGGSLPLTGYILWWKKRKIAKRNSQ